MYRFFCLRDGLKRWSEASGKGKNFQIFAARSHKWVEQQKERYKQKAVTGVKPLRRRVEKLNGQQSVNSETLLVYEKFNGVCRNLRPRKLRPKI